MAKKLSFIADNVTPISQNNRSTALLTRLRNELTAAHNIKYPANMLPRVPLINEEYLQAKVFYIHKVPDYKDADNISKPLWDSLNNHACCISFLLISPSITFNRLRTSTEVLRKYCGTPSVLGG